MPTANDQQRGNRASYQERHERQPCRKPSPIAPCRRRRGRRLGWDGFLRSEGGRGRRRVHCERRPAGSAERGIRAGRGPAFLAAAGLFGPAAAAKASTLRNTGSARRAGRAHGSVLARLARSSAVLSTAQTNAQDSHASPLTKPLAVLPSPIARPTIPVKTAIPPRAAA